jgi:type I restriction enzyme R subunit
MTASWWMSHRGYLLDRELSDSELSSKSFDDYISKYRRVLDHFDGQNWTSPPPRSTAQQLATDFNEPVYTYTYREAVVDGGWIDHEPCSGESKPSSQKRAWSEGW